MPIKFIRPATAPFLLEMGERTFIFDDLYCPRPDCDCQQAHLLCAELTEGARDGDHLDDLFTALISFDGLSKVGEVNAGTRADAEAIFAAWQIKYPDTQAAMRRHYDVVRDVAQRSLVEGGRPRPRSTRKPARNAPCPCGSGLKYKRCCARTS